MKNLVCALAIGLFGLVGPVQADCGSCGAGGEAHAADDAKAICSKCGHEKGTEACAEACAKGENCSDCGAVEGSPACEKNSGG